MKELNLHEEIIKSLKLISYDRSLTIREQRSIDDTELYNPKRELPTKKPFKTFKGTNPLDVEVTSQMDSDKNIKQKREKREKKEKAQKYIQKKIKQNCSSLIKKKAVDYTDLRAKEIFKTLQKNFLDKGTEEDEVLSAIYKINSKHVYEKLLLYFIGCFGSTTILPVIQSLEYSKGGQYVPKRFQNTSDKIDKNAEKFRSFQNTLNFNEGVIKEGGPNLANIMFAPRPGDAIQWNKNDEWLFLMQKHLTKFNPLEVYEKEKPQNFAQRILPPFTRESLHIFLPIVSFLFMLTPGGQGAGAMLSASLRTLVPELLDSGIYYFADKDPYMAGLTIIFAFLTVAEEFVIARRLKNLDMTSLLEKIYFKKYWELDIKELEVMSEIMSNPAKWVNISQKIALKRSILQASKKIFKSNNAKLIVKFINWLVEKGVMSSKAIAKFTLTVGGATLGWDAIANLVLGIDCRTFSWKELLELVGLNYIGELSLYLQPFTMDSNKKYCVDKLQKKFNNEYKKLTINKNQLPIAIFEKMIKENINFNNIDINDFNVEVVWVQLFLNAFQNNIDKDSKKLSPPFEKNNIDGTKNFNYNPKYDFLYKPQNKNKLESMRIDHKKTEKIKTGPIIRFKWGTFGENTKKVIMMYQKHNGLESTGILDRTLLNKMLSDIKSMKYGEIKNISGINLDSSTEKMIKKKILEDLKNDKLYELQKDTTLVQQKLLERKPELKMIVDSMEYYNNNLKPIDAGKALEEFLKQNPQYNINK